MVPQPKRPSTLTQSGEAAAGAAARYFLDLYPYALSSLSTSEFESMSGAGCVFCASVVDDVAKRARAETHEVGGTMTYSDVVAHETIPGSYLVSLSAHQQPSKTVDRNGSTVEDFPRTTVTEMTLLLHYKKGRWTVREATVESSRDA